MSPPVTNPPPRPPATSGPTTAAPPPPPPPPPENAPPARPDVYDRNAPKIDLRLRYEPMVSRGSSLVSTLGDTAARALEPAAQKDILGPEAQGRSRIQALTKSALDGIRPLEERASKLPAGSKERQAIEKEIDDRVNIFRNGLDAESVAIDRDVRAKRGSQAGDAFKKSLPSFMREAIDRKGLAIPGVPGGFVPRTDNGTFNGPTGLNWRIRF